MSSLYEGVFPRTSRSTSGPASRSTSDASWYFTPSPKKIAPIPQHTTPSSSSRKSPSTCASCKKISTVPSPKLANDSDLNPHSRVENEKRPWSTFRQKPPNTTSSTIANKPIKRGDIHHSPFPAPKNTFCSIIDANPAMFNFFLPIYKIVNLLFPHKNVTNHINKPSPKEHP